MLIFLLGFCGMSILLCFLYRLAAIYNREELLTSPAGLALSILIHPIYSLPAFAYYLWVFPSQQQVTDYIHTTFPQLEPFLSTHNCSITVPLRIMLPFALIAAVLILLLVAMGVGVMVLTFRKMGSMKGLMSQRTYRLHRMLSISLILQFAIPLTMVGMPYVLWAVLTYFNRGIDISRDWGNG